MPCQPCLSDGIWTAWNYLWQKYELFSTFFHYFPKFSTIFSTAQLCFFRSIKAFCRHVGSGKPPPPRPLALPHMYSITSSLPSSIICRPSLRPSLRRPLRPSLVHPPIIDHLSSITYPPSLRHHIIDYFSSITCTPSLRRPLVVHHLSSIICYLSPFPAWTNRVLALYRS